MSKSNTPSLAATKRAARAPKAVVSAPVVSAPAPVAPPAAPVVVPVRGGLAIASVKLTGKQYRVAAQQNQGWWTQVQAGVAAGKGTAAVADLVKAGVPAPFVGYVVRRGYLVAA